MQIQPKKVLRSKYGAFVLLLALKIQTQYAIIPVLIAGISYGYFAGVAQPVEQLIRNQQVRCSSHPTSSKKEGTTESRAFLFALRQRRYNLFYTL